MGEPRNRFDAGAAAANAIGANVNKLSRDDHMAVAFIRQDAASAPWKRFFPCRDVRIRLDSKSYS